MWRPSTPRSGSPYAGLGAFPVGKGSITKEKVWEPFGGKPVGIFCGAEKKPPRTNNLIVANDRASTARERTAKTKFGLALALSAAENEGQGKKRERKKETK